MHRLISLLLALSIVVAAGPAAAADTGGPCPAGLSNRLVAEVFFGRNIANRVGVSEQAFRRFVDQDITPRFPDGFTIIDTHGQYRDGDKGPIVREPGKLLLIALDDEAGGMTSIRELIDIYKRRFDQKSVGLITRRACVSF